MSEHVAVALRTLRSLRLQYVALRYVTLHYGMLEVENRHYITVIASRVTKILHTAL